MIHYDRNVEIVQSTLAKYGYSRNRILLSQKWYGELKNLMRAEDEVSFSPERAMDWGKVNVAKEYRVPFAKAVYRITDVYEHGRVLGSHLKVFGKPSESFRKAIDGYFASLPASSFAAKTLVTIRMACRHFCCFAQCNGIFSVEEIDYPLLEQYHQYMKDADGSYRDYQEYTSRFLRYLAETGRCRYGLSLFMHYVWKGKCTSLADLSDAARLFIESHRKDSGIFPADEFYRTISDFAGRLAASGYSRSFMDCVPYHMELLCIFLDRENTRHRSDMGAGSPSPGIPLAAFPRWCKWCGCSSLDSSFLDRFLLHGQNCGSSIHMVISFYNTLIGATSFPVQP